MEAWLDDAMQRQSVQACFQKPYEGDDSAENCAAKVAEVFALQQTD